MYAVHPISRDCSSIGQSTALSRRKLRVRAPSVPTDSINTSIQLFLFCERWDRGQGRISFPRRSFFLFSFAFLIKIKQIEYHMFCFPGAHTQMEFVSCTTQNKFNIIPSMQYPSRLNYLPFWLWFWVTSIINLKNLFHSNCTLSF